MSRSAVSLAIVMEMHLLLGPLSLGVAIALMPSVVLGFPHVLGLMAGPIARHDLVTLALMAALLPLAFALLTLWTLGAVTARRQVYRFGMKFWIAVACALLATAMLADFIDPRAPLVLLPAWLFLLHMTALQIRLRALRSSTRSAS